MAVVATCITPANLDNKAYFSKGVTAEDVEGWRSGDVGKLESDDVSLELYDSELCALASAGSSACGGSRG